MTSNALTGWLLQVIRHLLHRGTELHERTWKKRTSGNVTINAATLLASIWERGGISARSGSWGCTCGEWPILWDCDPCRCTTGINQKHQSSLVRGTFSPPPPPPFEAFIKSTPLRPILEPLPCANIYHHLKVHLLVHQSFGDLCRLLEMDVIWKETQPLHYVTKHQSK